MDKIYMDAIELDEAMQSRYLSQLRNGESVGVVQKSVERDLLEIMVFCKWCLERLRGI